MHPRPTPPPLAPDAGAARTRVRLLDGGAEAFPRMLEALRGARARVHLEVYTFEREGVGQAFVAALTEAAARGVAVRVVVDGWGTFGEAGALSDTLAAAGVRVRVHNPLTSLLTGRAWRNHRKVLLVDDAVAFVGGINVGDAYAGDPLSGVPGWADLVLELTGPVVRALGARLTAGHVELADGPVRVLLSGVGRGRRLRRRYEQALRTARRRVVLAHAYFLPGRDVVRALQRAARRGVRVELLLAGRSDVPFARAATRRLYRLLLPAGVRIREWTGSTLHAKAALVDDRTLLVGSFNLDPLSLVNLETLVEVEDAGSDPTDGAVAQARAWFERHLAAAQPVALAPAGGVRGWVADATGLLVARLVQWVARVLGRRVRRR